MNTLARVVVVVLAALLVNGCNPFKSRKKDNVTPPAPLTEFAASRTPTRLWSVDVGAGEGRARTGLAPAADGERVFVADAAGTIRSLSLGSGGSLWSTKVDLRTSGGVGVGEGIVVVPSLDGTVIALDEGSGAERWRSKISSEGLARPVIADGVVIVRSNDGRVFGLSAADGSRRWVFDRALPTMTLRGLSTPLVTRGAVFIGYDTGEIISLTLADGVQRWEQPVSVPEGRNELVRIRDLDGDLVVIDDAIYGVAFQGQAVALSGADGRQGWNRELSSANGIGTDGTNLFVSAADGKVTALEPSAGTALWTQDALGYRWLTRPASHNGSLLVGDLEGYLHWLDPATGALVARARAGKDAIRTAPVVAGDIALVLSTGGVLSAWQIGG